MTLASVKLYKKSKNQSWKRPQGLTELNFCIDKGYTISKTNTVTGYAWGTADRLQLWARVRDLLARGWARGMRVAATPKFRCSSLPVPLLQHTRHSPSSSPRQRGEGVDGDGKEHGWEGSCFSSSPPWRY